MNNETETATVAPSQGTTNPWSDAPIPSYDLGGGEKETTVTTPPTPKSPTATPAQTTPPPTPSAPSFDKETIAELGRTIAQSVKGPEKQPEMTMEEFNRVMNVYNVTPEEVQKLGLNPETAPILHQMMQNVAKQAVTMATYQINLARQQLEAKLNEGLSPLQQYHQKQQEQALESEFLASYPQLKDFRPVLELVYTKMKAEGYQPKSKEDAFQTVAERAEALIKTLPGMASTTTENTGAKPAPAPKAHKMSTLTGGGQGGAGASAGQPKKSTAQYLFG